MDLMSLQVIASLFALSILYKLLRWYGRYRKNGDHNLSDKALKWRILRVASAGVVIIGLLLGFILGLVASKSIFPLAPILAAGIGAIIYFVATVMEGISSP